MHYPWSPMINRKPLRWPHGKKLAVIITMNCEYWDLTKDTTEPYYAGGPPMLPDSPARQCGGLPQLHLA